MLNKNLLIMLIGIGMLSLTGGYTAPTYDSINMSLCSGYTAPTYNSINFTLSESDACVTDSCTYTSGNWEIDCSDNCSISSEVDVEGNNISIIGTGTFFTSVNISNYGLLHIEGDNSSSICTVTCDGGCFR